MNKNQDKNNHSTIILPNIEERKMMTLRQLIIRNQGIYSINDLKKNGLMMYPGDKGTIDALVNDKSLILGIRRTEITKGYTQVERTYTLTTAGRNYYFARTGQN